MKTSLFLRFFVNTPKLIIQCSFFTSFTFHYVSNHLNTILGELTLTLDIIEASSYAALGTREAEAVAATME